MTSATRSGMVYTFYSYKGGVGRSMALANVAALLAKWGQTVLVVDWDLEAPGIERFFRKWLDGSRAKTGGVIDIVESYARDATIEWQRCLLKVAPPRSKPIDVISAGREDDQYVARLRGLDWEGLFGQQRLGNYLESLRHEWQASYDCVLIDSRTGITDIGGVCTIHLPDVVVVFFTSNDQSLTGVKDVLLRARRAHAGLPVDRRRLLAVPVPSRDESGSEHDLAEEWRRKFAAELGEFFDDWVPKDEKPTVVLNYLKIPYIPYWSFGERIPVLEQEDPDNPKTLAYAYQPLAKLLLRRLDWRAARQEALPGENAAVTRVADRADEERVATFIHERLEPEIEVWELRARRQRAAQRSALLVGGLGLTIALWYALSSVVRVSESLFTTLAAAGPLMGVVGVFAMLAALGLRLLGRENTATEAAEGLRREHSLFVNRAGHYADPNASFSLFVTNVEEILADGARAYKGLGIKDRRPQSPESAQSQEGDH